MSLKFIELPTIETENLILRRVEIADAQDVHSFTSKNQVSDWLSWEPHKDVDQTTNFIKSVVQKYENDEAAQWAICLRPTNKVIGFCGFINYFKEHGKGEVAYVLSPEHWGKGFLTESLNAIINLCFKNFDFIRIEAKCELDNLASEKVMQKVGMRHEGTLRNFLIRKGKIRTYKLYSIIRDDKVS